MTRSRISPGFGRTGVGKISCEVSTGSSSGTEPTEEYHQREIDSGKEDSLLSNKNSSPPRGAHSRPVLAGPLATEVPVVLGGEPGRGACATTVQRRIEAGRQVIPRVSASPLELATSTSQRIGNVTRTTRQRARAEKAHSSGVPSTTGERGKERAEVLSHNGGDGETLAMGILPAEILHALLDGRVMEASAGDTQTSAELEGETLGRGREKGSAAILGRKGSMYACFSGDKVGSHH